MVLKAWYPLDTDYLDYSGNTFNGTNSGTSFVTGKIDNGADFEESSDTKITISELTMSGSAFSFVCWLKVESSDDTFGRICDSNGSEFNLFAETVWSSGLRTNQFFGASAFTLTSTDLSSGWKHLVITVDLSSSSDNVKVYVNGSLDTTHSKSLNSTYSITSMVLGDDQIDANRNFDGILDEVMFYDHVLNTTEIDALYSGTYNILDGFVIKGEVFDGFVNQTALFRLRRCNLVVSDNASNTLINRLAVGDGLHIIDNYKIQFRGIIDDYYYTEEKQIEINAYDESFLLAEEFISTYTTGASDKASDIVSYLVTTFGQGLFTQNITATIRQYGNKTYRARSPLEIIQELAFNEDYLFFVSPQRVFNFVPTNSNDLGVTVEVGKEIFSFSFPVDNTKMKNFIVIIGKGATDTAGVKEIIRDADSISKYGKRVLRIEDTSITSTDQAVERGEAELARRSNPLIVGKIEVARDFDKTAGSIIGITNSQEGWVNKKFLIVEATHELDIPVSHLQLAEVDIQNSDQIADILSKQRIMSKNFEDDNTPLTFTELVVENITVSMELYVERETNVVRNWNESNWNTIDWDVALGTTWTKLVNGENMVITNNGLNRIRDLVQGEGVTALNSDNTYIAVGTGTGGASLTDTTLGTETDRNAMDSGFPRDGTTNGSMEHQASFDDTDFTSATLTEVGLFDASSSGTLIARLVPASSFSKSANENIRIRVKTTFQQ